jgi:hypothetical protein
MPSDDAIWLPGCDGYLINEEEDENRFVPLGKSVWEFGTTDNYRKKALEDYEKRMTDMDDDGNMKRNALNIDRLQATFVFVTPRHWVNDKEAWVNERKRDGIWKDVVVIDAVDLQDWIEYSPAVSLQFAAELGYAPSLGLLTPDQAWEEWSYLSTPPISEHLSVAGREEQEKELISRLMGEPETFIVRGDSPREALGFVLAAVIRIESPEERHGLYSRMIVADNEEVAGGLRSLKNLIVLIKQAMGPVPNLLSSRGSHVIVPMGNNYRSPRGVITLQKPTYLQFAEVLSSMGIKRDEAERMARACGRSITIFQRLNASANHERPRWANEASSINLLPALLAGRWNDKSEEDRAILCQLANTQDYNQITDQLQEYLLVDEPPLQRIGTMWALTAPVDAFHLLARRLRVADLDRFRDAFRDVFGRIDPKVELPPDAWIHDVSGEKGNSEWLRSGMAETFLLIAERGADADLLCIRSPQEYIDSIVIGLSGLDDWRLLASLRDQYPLLLEAAPGPFLDSLGRLIGARPDDVRRLFADGDVLFGGGNMHTGLLWGLEILAWSPRYLLRVALILAELATIAPNVKIHNRPINSLREIFLSWNPGTSASLEERLTVIDQILTQKPNIGWSLIANLLPTYHSASHYTAKPRWRNFGEPPKDANNRNEQILYISAIIDHVLAHVGTDPERWEVVLESLGMMGSVYQSKAIDQIEAISYESQPEEIKYALWKNIRDFINQHRTFKDAGWTLPPEMVDRLDSILPRLSPTDPLERNKWLFDEWTPKLPSGEKDTAQREKDVYELRKQAVGEIFQEKGDEGLVTLGTTCRFPGFVAISLVQLFDKERLLDFIVQAVTAGDAGLIFAAQISGQADEVYGDSWRHMLIDRAQELSLSSDIIGSLLIWWHDNKATWDEIANIGKEVEESYWRRKQVYLLNGTLEDRNFQIDRLIAVGRASVAFNCIAYHGKEMPTETLLKLFDATFNELVRAQTPEDVRKLGIEPHAMQEYLKMLRQRPDMDRVELARREFQVLPLLGWIYEKGLVIHDILVEDPNLFIEALCNVFLPHNRDKSETYNPKPEEQRRAEICYRLLKGINKIPGQTEGNQINDRVIKKWISDVRTKAADVFRTAVADEKIGEILAHAPKDPQDDGWPHQVVRDIIEILVNDGINNGIMVERYNMRGTFTKSLYEGGAQERALASQYRKWADISRSQWLRTADLLDNIAKGWETDAIREDERAEQDKLRDN